MSVFCYQHNIDAWRRKTAHLSFQERGAYRELMDAYYATEGRLPADKRIIYRITGAQDAGERKAISKILAEFFTEKDGYFHQKHCEEELRRIKEKSEKAAKSVSARYKENKDIASTNVGTNEPTNEESEGYERTTDEPTNYKPITNNQDKKESAPLLTAARENAAPPPEDPPEIKIIQAFDAAIVRSFGTQAARIAPAPMDRVTAKRWIEAGATVEACIGVIDAVVARQKARNGKPPGTLGYFENPIREALANASSITPDLSPVDQAPLSLPQEVSSRLQSSPTLREFVRPLFDKCRFDGATIYAPTEFIAKHIRSKFLPDLNACFQREMSVQIQQDTMNCNAA